MWLPWIITYYLKGKCKPFMIGVHTVHTCGVDKPPQLPDNSILFWEKLSLDAPISERCVIRFFAGHGEAILG